MNRNHNAFRSVTCVWGAGLCLLAMVSPSSAQSDGAAVGQTIKAVEFRGLAQTKEADAADIARIRAGQPLRREALEQAVSRLLQSQRFLSATYKLTEEADGVVVVFNVRERPILTAVRFEGNDRIRTDRLQEAVKLKLGTPIDLFAVRDARQAIVAVYHDSGYSDAVVAFDRDRLDETGALVFTIQEGRRVRITEIRFEGNRSFEDRVLKRQIAMRTSMWIFRSGAFDEEQADDDLTKLRSYYRDQGFLDAGVRYRLEKSDGGDSLTVIFEIDEGVRYRIEDIRFRGHTAFSTEELLARIESHVGSIALPRGIADDARQVQTLYGEQGYIYATARPIRVFSDQPGFVIVTIDISEGEQFRVGQVMVRGNTRTKDKVVRRALNLYPPDDLFNLSETKEAERRLRETSIFSSARVHPAGDAPGVRDVVMDVTEADKLGDFLFGAGITSNSGIVGSIVLDLKNFDINDRPRSLSELVKLRAFSGAGQHMRIELQPGNQLSRFRIDFTEPYLFDKPLRFDSSAYFFQRRRDGYSEGRTGVILSLGKRFDRSILRNWSGEVSFRAEELSVTDTDLFAASEVHDDKGNNLLTGIKTSLARNRTDNRLVPTSGDSIRLSVEQFGVLGGDFSFLRLSASYSWFKTVREDVLGRKSVFRLRARGGALIGDAPVPERYYAGGIGSLRGFAFRGVGERSGLDDTNIGGDFQLLVGGEYAFPLIRENIRGLLFVDTGAVGSGPLRASIGAGIRMTLELLRNVPLELSVGWPISKDSEDDTQVLGFVIGRLF